MASDDLRRILKVFGVSVTDFADEAERIKERAAGLGSAGPGESAALLCDLCELLIDVEEKLGEVNRSIVGLRRGLFEAVAQGAKDQAGG